MFLRHKLIWVMLAGLWLSLSACKPSTAERSANAAPTQVASAPTLAPAATTPPTSTPNVIPPTATVAPTAAPQPTDQDLAQLKALITAKLSPDQPIAPDQSIGVSVLPLTTAGSLSPLYAAYSTGSIFSLGGEVRHVLALYTFAAGHWDEVQKITIDNADYVDSGSVKQVPIEPGHIWLEVQSGAGAHSGCYDLIAFEPVSRSVSQQISHCNSSSGAGYTADVNGDGQLDVILDGTDYYVFCYACGVTRPQVSVLAWDGAQLSEVTLSTLFDTKPAEVQQFNNAAVQLARAGLWKDAQTAIDQAIALKTESSIVRWNAALIAQQVKLNQAQIQAQSFPLLNHLFYGDYAAALDVLRPYPPADLFRVNPPLVAGTPAENSTDALAKYISDSANAALQAKPDLAAAYFLRGWATYLQNPGSQLALDDIRRAAELAPDDKLFSASVQLLKK
jgi:hypothetical protein